ncbi:MAG: hypothetical protein JSW39_02420 [Desulfobacterales bacterium]|nr:MAG: hypothetical protein JSW39_02420 [Desulfobacterales bacterium]
MRGALMLGIVIVLLIIGMLVMKNMGGDTSGDVTRTQAKKYLERAEDAAHQVEERVKDRGERRPGTDQP